MAQTIKTIGFVSSFCMAFPQTHLTEMSHTGICKGRDALLKGVIGHLVVSNAYGPEVSAREAAFKVRILKEAELVEGKHYTLIHGIEDSFDEALSIRDLVKDHDVKEVVVIGDSYQIVRSIDLFRRYYPGLMITPQPFYTVNFERTYEPHSWGFLGWIKGWRTAFKPTWRAWNWLFFQLQKFKFFLHKPQPLM